MYLIYGDTYKSLIEAKKILDKDNNAKINIIFEGSRTINLNLILQHLKTINVHTFNGNEEKIYQYYISTGLNSDIITIDHNLKINNLSDVISKCNVYYDTIINKFENDSVTINNGQKIFYTYLIWTCHPYLYLKYNPTKILKLPALYRAIIPVLKSKLDNIEIDNKIVKKRNFVIKIYRSLNIDSITADNGKEFLIIEALSLDNIRNICYNNNEIQIKYNNNENDILRKFHELIQKIYNKITKTSSSFIQKETNICDQGTCTVIFNIETNVNKLTLLEMELNTKI